MLYPLSYEGVPALSYRRGDTYECLGGPIGAERSHRTHWRRVPSLIGAHAERISGAHLEP
jgi:hypothetical protein